MKAKKTKRSSGSAGTKKGQSDGTRVRVRETERDPLSTLLSVYPGSTLLPINEPLKRLLSQTDKSTLIHLALNWIHTAQTSYDPNVVHPTLAKDAATEARRLALQNAKDDQLTAADRYELERLLVAEQKRAKSLDELRLVWCSHISESESGRIGLVERIVEVDWPTGITFSMAAMVSFEMLRAYPLSRTWSALYLDYGDEGDTFDKGRRLQSDRKRPYENVTAQQLKDRFSSELRHFCTNSVFVDQPVKRLAIRSQMYDTLAPLPTDWTKPFVHLRVVSCATPMEICSKAWHILHLPETPWFLFSGPLSGKGGTTGQLAIAALAHSLGARRMRAPSRSKRSNLVSIGPIGELQGRDASALRQLIMAGYEVQDGEQTAGLMPGGKGRDMRNNEAEDGPLVEAEKRKRTDATGLYEETDRRQAGEIGHVPTHSLSEHESAMLHPAERRWFEKQKRIERRRRKREADELFGHGDVQTDPDCLPRFQQITCNLHMPFPSSTSSSTHDEMALDGQSAIQLKLHGSHVLAGLRLFVERGLDRHRTKEDNEQASGLPSWLIDLRGTNISVGKREEGESTLHDASLDGSDVQSVEST